jgi:hypothetical protein
LGAIPHSVRANSTTDSSYRYRIGQTPKKTTL